MACLQKARPLALHQMDGWYFTLVVVYFYIAMLNKCAQVRLMVLSIGNSVIQLACWTLYRHQAISSTLPESGPTLLNAACTALLRTDFHMIVSVQTAGCRIHSPVRLNKSLRQSP